MPRPVKQTAKQAARLQRNLARGRGESVGRPSDPGVGRRANQTPQAAGAGEAAYTSTEPPTVGGARVEDRPGASGGSRRRSPTAPAGHPSRSREPAAGSAGAPLFPPGSAEASVWQSWTSADLRLCGESFVWRLEGAYRTRGKLEPAPQDPAGCGIPTRERFRRVVLGSDAPAGWLCRKCHSRAGHPVPATVGATAKAQFGDRR